MRRLGFPVALTSAVLLAGCAVPPPSGPTVMALPQQGKPFETFQQEDAYCRQTAAQGPSAATAANAQNDSVGNAVVGTALGAAAGALLGAASGNAGAGAAVGAGAGLLVGSAAGGNTAARGGYAAQSQFDSVYTQCMYAYGNSVQSAPTPYPAR